MLGERIVEPFPAIEDVESLLSLPEPCGGLTVRRVKSAGLRIVTEGDALWPASSSVGSTLHSSLLSPNHAP